MQSRGRRSERGEALTAALVAGAVLLFGTAVVATTVVRTAASLPAPPPPSITSGPATGSTVAASSVSFTYGATLSGVAFECSLDGGTFKGCPATGVSFARLADGSHTFQVRATARNRPDSPAAWRSWRVDTTAPLITISHPSAAAFNATGWSTLCGGGPGLCGTATDGAGVAKVEATVVQHATGKHWDGTAFAATAQVFQTAAGTVAWRLPLALPADGSYGVVVRATDALGNVSRPSGYVAWAWKVDTVAPPAPTITKGPDDATADTSPTFSYADAEQGVAFECALDGAAFAPCGAKRAAFENLPTTDHCFQVRAVDPAGNASPPASSCWTIVLGQGFGVTGSTTGYFVPGMAQALNLTFANPYNFPIKVLSVSITIDDATTKGATANPACVGSANLAVTRAFTGPVTVPAKSTRTLQQLAVPTDQWPLVELLDMPWEQDGCQGTTFTLSYAGTATKP